MKRSNDTMVAKSDVTTFENLRDRYLEELAELRSKYGVLFVALIREVATSDTLTRANN